MIEAKNLTKKFDSIVAVDHIDARIREGCVFGLIGTNGAGISRSFFRFSFITLFSATKLPFPFTV